MLLAHISLIAVFLFVSLAILIKPVYGVYLIIISVVLEAFYLSVFDGNLKIPYILVAIVLIGLIFCVLIKGKIRIEYDPFRRIVLFFLVLNLISMFYAPTIIDCLKNSLLYVFFASIFFTITILINPEERLRTSLNLLLVATIVVSLFGLAQLVGWTVFRIKMPTPNYSGFMSLSEMRQWLRPAATFVEPDQFGKFSVFIVSFFIPFWIYKRKNDSSIHLSFKMVRVTMILSLGSMIIAQTRSAWLGFLAGIGSRLNTHYENIGKIKHLIKTIVNNHQEIKKDYAWDNNFLEGFAREKQTEKLTQILGQILG